MDSIPTYPLQPRDPWGGRLGPGFPATSRPRNQLYIGIRMLLKMGLLFYKWVCLKMLCSPKPNGFHDHYPYNKWLFHWEYTLFSDKPKWDD